ncbi:MAG: hypothetical protein ACI8W7_001037 [Gammaproteobacteria bacterium]|jgi:hypothetical protein
MPARAQRFLSSAQLLPAEQFWHDLHHEPARRRSPRVHANVPVSLSLIEGTAVPLSSNDLSYHGMQLRCDRVTATILRPDSHDTKEQAVYAATLKLEIDGITLRISAHARIAYVALLPDAPASTEVAIGMEFVRYEDGAQQALERFIEHHMVPAGWP